MLPLGTPAPEFELPSVDRGTYGLGDFSEAGALLVMFICNHCPYVRHIEKELSTIVSHYSDRGLAAVGICSNDVDQEPEDTPDGLREQTERVGFTFPYLIDESQDAAKAYKAACTPDLYLFDGDRRLAYRGRLDASRPRNDEPITGEDLRNAIDAVLAGNDAPGEQMPSMGCAISWKPGNEPT
jgi:peroxiredoxin